MKKLDAFVTIEYSLLLPVILTLFTMLVCIGLYLHNQCVLQTNVYILSIEGARLNVDDEEQRIMLLQKKETELYNDKYILAEDMQTTYQIKGNEIAITGGGRMVNPFSLFGMGESAWELSAESKANVINPSETLRVIKNVRNLLEKLPLEEEREDDS